MQRVPILSYHSLDESGSVISTPPEHFRRQMEWLARAGYQAITVSEFTEWRQDTRPGPDKPVIITFDDGFRNVYTVAAPILRHFGFRATIFIAVNYCGRRNDWPTQSDDVPRLPLLDWDEVRSLRRGGMEIGSHTLTHPPLTQIPAVQAEEEIAKAKAVIERELQQPVCSFAYPYGDYNAEVRARVAALYSSACGTRLGFAGKHSDLFALERIDAYYLRSSFMASQIGAAWMAPYLRLRQGLRAARGTDRYYRSW